LTKSSFFHRLNTLWVSKHESIPVKLRNRLDIEVMVGLLVAAEELFDGDGCHVFIEARNWTKSELTFNNSKDSNLGNHFPFPRF